jgi:DNA-directed RNA polymerase subunit RPC12/RpoP
MEDDQQIECPMCGWHIILEGACGMECDERIECRGTYGMECLRCEEIFDVPIGSEDQTAREILSRYGDLSSELMPPRPGTPPSPVVGKVNIDCLACGALTMDVREDGLHQCDCGELCGWIYKPLKEE